MNSRAIVPVKISLTAGDFYTLWAPTWRHNGADWQAFLGDEEHVLLFHSEAELLAYLESGARHDLRDHPHWAAFAARDAARVHPAKRDIYDLIGMPNNLAGRASHENVSTVARNLELAQSLGQVTGADHATIFFATHSILRSTARGADHYSGKEGQLEWTAVGHVVASNWAQVISSLDAGVRVVPSSEIPGADEASLARYEEDIAAAIREAEAAREEAEAALAAAQKAEDPYDSSPWGLAGIDPIKATINLKSVYTLRTYVDGSPVFLGRWGEIYTFATPKQLLRWIIENDAHDLAAVATWGDITTAANAGELELVVHPDNAYNFTGLVNDIEKGPEVVDSKQLARAYELCADAADWAADDSINSYMLAHPRFQDYLGYMLGSTEHAGYVPSKPYSDHASAWRDMEEMLVKRFSKF